MRIGVFTNLDLHSNLAVNHLLPELKKHSFTLFLSEKIGGPQQLAPALQFMSYLEKDFVTGKIFPFIEGHNDERFLSFDQISKKFNAPIRIVSTITDTSILESLRANSFDLFIVIRFGKIFKGEIFSIPKQGIINLHSAILPDFKGVMGTLRAMQFNSAEIGATLHYINDSTIDTGDIIQIVKLKPLKSKSVLWNIANLYEPACRELSKVIAKIGQQEKIEATKQSQGGSYFSFPTQSDFDQLHKRSIKLFNLEEYAELLNQYYKVEKAWVLKQIANDPKGAALPVEL